MSNFVTNVGSQGGNAALLYTYNYANFNTGADVSYATGDDKWVRDNVYTPEIATWDTSLKWVFPVLDPSDPFTLLRGSNPDGSGNNIFGNKRRFTDLVGDAVVENFTGIYFDHLTGQKIAMTFNGLDIGNSFPDWESRLDYPFNNLVAGETGYHLPNYNEIMSFVVRFGVGYIRTFSNKFVQSSTTTATTANNYEFFFGSGGFATIASLVQRVKTQAITPPFYTKKAFTYNTTTKQMELS